MGFQFNGLTARVTLTGGLALPQPTSDQTPVTAGVFAAGHPATVYTVPAGKIFYCYGLNVGGNGASAGKVIVGGVDTLGFMIGYTGGSDANVSLSGGILFVAAAGETVVFSCNLAGGISGSIWGILVNA